MIELLVDVRVMVRVMVSVMVSQGKIRVMVTWGMVKVL